MSAKEYLVIIHFGFINQLILPPSVYAMTQSIDVYFSEFPKFKRLHHSHSESRIIFYAKV